MNQICIRIPSLEEVGTVGVEVTAGGTRRVVNYRVDACDWGGVVEERDRIERLRAFIRSHEEHWELVSIGRPVGTLVPVTFRARAGRV